MIQYCENRVDCKRTQLLQYFGETFSRDECKMTIRTTCDNCANDGRFKRKDVTSDAKTALTLINSQAKMNKNFTLLHYTDVLKGSKSQKIIQHGHAQCPEHGKLGNLNKSDVERILKKMILDNVLREKLETSPHHTIICYLHPGPKSQDLMSGRVKVFLDMEVRTQTNTNTNSGPTDAVSVVVKACFDLLMETRKLIALEKNLAVHNILTTETLHEMSEVRPHTVSGLKEITGFVQLKVDFYGARFLEVLQKFPAGKNKADNDWINMRPAGEYLDRSSLVHVPARQWRNQYFRDSRMRSGRI